MNTHFPSLDFDLGEDIEMLREAVYQFARSEIAPRAAEIDRDNLFPADLWTKMGDLGLLGITVEEEYGGSNLGIAGHRDGFFRPLKDIALGDVMTLQTTRGTESFKVSSIDIVDPSDVSVLAPTETSTITLVTCYPFYYVGHAPKRFIVKATAEHFLAN